MKDSELLALLRLQRLPRIGDISAKKLLRKFGSAEDLFKAKKSDLLQIEGFGQSRLTPFFDHTYAEQAKRELAFIKQHEIGVSYYKENAYPELLKQCIDAPILLFQKGTIDLKHKRLLSIVGTRKATVMGTAFCEELLERLQPLNPVIISGFAYGIDIAAHKAALKYGLQTIGCMAHGLNQIYPKMHAQYRAEVEANGGFFTDFWSESKFDRKNFLKRNRIIAGLSEATLVVESGKKGGSLVTADIAQSYNREVFAVPGRPSDKLSVGCNDLIKAQKAQAITSAEDIIYFLNWDLESRKPKAQPQLFVELSTEEERIMTALKSLGKAELDDIALTSQLPSYKVASHLLNLELNNLIRPLPGKQYEVL